MKLFSLKFLAIFYTFLLHICQILRFLPTAIYNEKHLPYLINSYDFIKIFLLKTCSKKKGKSLQLHFLKEHIIFF